MKKGEIQLGGVELWQEPRKKSRSQRTPKKAPNTSLNIIEGRERSEATTKGGQT